MGVLQYEQRHSENRPLNPSRRQSLAPRNSPSFPSGPSSPVAISSLLPIEQAALLSQLTVGASPISLTPGVSDQNLGAPPDNFFNSVLQFWRLLYMSNFWPAHIYTDPSHQAVQYSDGWIRGMVINNPAMLHGLFSGALSYITNCLPPTESTPMLWSKAIHHYGRCLEDTRTQLARPDIGSEEALSLINGMSSFSFHCGDLESCKVHRRASARLLQGLEGGLESVHPVLKYLVVLGSSLIASHVPRRSSIELDTWAPKPWIQEESLRPFDGLLRFDSHRFQETDVAIFLLEAGWQQNDYSQDLLDLINWHREAMAANELAFVMANGSVSASPGTVEPVSGSGSGRDRADPIYTWLSLRQHALNCLTSDMFMDFLESEEAGLSLFSQLFRSFHCCTILAINYLFQFVMRRDMDSPSMAYIPFQHLRSQLELLQALMSQHRRTQMPSGGQQGGGRGPVNPIPTGSLLFLFFVGAVGEECDGPRRTRGPPQMARAGIIPSPSAENPGDLINDRWFSVHFAMILQRLNIDDWEIAKRLLKRFFYNERVLDGFLQVLVTRKLEFLAALVAGVPSHVGPSSSGFIGRPGGPVSGSVREGAGSSSRPPGLSRPSTSTSQIPREYGTRVGHAGLPMTMTLTSPGLTSSLGPEQLSDTSSLFVPISLPTTTVAPIAAADWWQDMGYGLGSEADFSMDLDMHLNMDPGLENLEELQMADADLGQPETGEGEEEDD